MKTQISVALVGAGAMGGALMKAWLAHDALDVGRSAVFEPSPSPELAAALSQAGVAVNPQPERVSADALVLAIKPQAIEATLPAFAPIAAAALTVSVMAGASVARIARALSLGEPPRVIRAMPNIASLVGAGVSALAAAPGVAAADRDCAERLMAAAGATVWLDGEDAIDAATAVSGSGPAYFFLLAEALAEAGAAAGLARATADALARATATGAGAVLAADPRAAAALMRAVASPGGTTEAALAVLDGEGASLRRLMKEAVAAAARRAGELKS